MRLERQARLSSEHIGTFTMWKTSTYTGVNMNRRRFLVGNLSSLAASRFMTSLPFLAQDRKIALPQRRELLLKNAYVMTMDSALGDIAGGDIHVKNGEIAAVGKGIKAPGATVLDGQRSIVLPGFVETHWHMWNTLLRS